MLYVKSEHFVWALNYVMERKTGIADMDDWWHNAIVKGM